jgi:hypothetical protein
LAVFDATVLCGALRKPTGYNFKLLELAADGTLLQGFTTDIAGMEFVRNALDGLSGVSYDMELIEAFLDHFAPLFNPDNVEPSPVGRALPARVSLHNRPIGEIVYEMTGRTREDLLNGLPRHHIERSSAASTAAAVSLKIAPFELPTTFESHMRTH